MASNTAQADANWFSATPHDKLFQHLYERADVHFYNLPQTALTVDARTYENPLHVVRALSPDVLHLVTLSTASPAGPVGMFLRVLPASQTGIEYCHDTVSLRLTPVREARAQIGARGVAALSGVAELQWAALVCHITDKSLEKVGIHIGQVIGIDEKSISFPPLLSLKPKYNATPTEVTAFYLDRTQYVKELVHCNFDGQEDELLAQFQLSFICFSYLACVHGIEHWTRLLKEVCGCARVDGEFPGLSGKMARILDMQFQMMDVETMQFCFGGLRQSVGRFVSAGWADEDVKRLAKTVNEKMGWVLTGAEEEGDDSDGPVMV